MNIHILQSSEITKAKKIWLSLEKEYDYVPFNVQWDYIETWIDAFGDEVPHWFLYGEEKGKAVGIVLLTKEVGRDVVLPIKGYALGPDGENFTERVGLAGNTILATKKYKKKFIEELFITINNEFQWEEINLQAFSDEELDFLSHIFQKLHLRYSMRKRESHGVNIGNPKDVFEILEYNLRHRVRRSIKAFGDLEVEWAQTLDDAKSMFKDLVILHQESWKRRGKPGMFASARVTKFHTDLIEKMFEQNRVALLRVTSRRLGPIGVIYSYLDGGSVLGYQSGFADFEQSDFPDVNINRVKPGYVTHAFCIDESIKRGFTLYSFGPGHQIYKKEFANTTEVLRSIHLRKGIKPVIRQKVLEQYAKMDNTGSPVLKPLYSLYSKFK